MKENETSFLGLKNYQWIKRVLTEKEIKNNKTIITFSYVSMLVFMVLIITQHKVGSSDTILILCMLFLSVTLIQEFTKIILNQNEMKKELVHSQQIIE